MKKELIQLLKDFYSDRDMFNKHGSPFESTMEIYEKHSERIRERVKLMVIEIVTQYNGHSSHAPEDKCIEEIVNEIENL
jgi:hypothetical protein